MTQKHSGEPIAVIDQHGHIHPFTTNGVDAVHLLKMGVTYVYTKEQLKKAIDTNQQLIGKADFESPQMFVGESRLAVHRPRETNNQMRSRIEIINPEQVPLNT